MSKALDDAHDATTLRTGGSLGPRQSVRLHRRRLAIVWRCPLTIEKFAAKGEFGSAMAVGHEAEVADAMEAIGQRVKKEAADELVGLELHDLCRAVLAVVLPGKGDVILVEGYEPAVGYCNAMGIAAEIGQHLRGTAERPLGVDNPADAPHGDEVSCEGSRLGQRCEIAEEVQGAGVEGGGQTFEEQASEQPGERFDGQEEVWSAGDPARAIGREAAARHDAVDVGMVRQRLSSGVEDGHDADPGAEPAWIGGERRHRLGGGFEQDRINDGLVLKGDRGDRSRQCEDDVEIGNRQQVGFSRGEPRGPGWPLTLRTVPVATGNGRRPLPVLWAKPVMGSWRQLDRAPALITANPALHYEVRLRSSISLSVGWKTPRRRWGGTIASIASSFSVGSPRV